jgi:CheY-like chemotaxis protein
MKNHQILMIVEDDVDDRIYFCNAVKKIDENIKCLEAWNGAQAIEILKNLKKLPDFIFMDINLPIMNGLDCLEYIKEDEILKNIPVIIYTTSKYQKNSDYTRELGAASFITKHVDTKELPALIRSAMEKVKHNNDIQ